MFDDGIGFCVCVRKLYMKFVFHLSRTRWEWESGESELLEFQFNLPMGVNELNLSE